MDSIEFIRSKFGSLQTIDPDGPLYKKLCELLDRCDDKALDEIVNQKIKFVSALALNRVIRRQQAHGKI